MSGSLWQSKAVQIMMVRKKKEKKRLPGRYISSESIPIITCFPSVRSYILQVSSSSSKTISWSPD